MNDYMNNDINILINDKNILTFNFETFILITTTLHQ